jgi:hypothetical protein
MIEIVLNLTVQRVHTRPWELLHVQFLGYRGDAQNAVCELHFQPVLDGVRLLQHSIVRQPDLPAYEDRNLTGKATDRAGDIDKEEQLCFNNFRAHIPASLVIQPGPLMLPDLTENKFTYGISDHAPRDHIFDQAARATRRTSPGA